MHSFPGRTMVVYNWAKAAKAATAAKAAKANAKA